MRKTIAMLGLGAALLAAGGCYLGGEPWPSTEDAKAIRVLEQPDPRTLDIYGHVTTQRTVAPADWQQAEQLTIEKLKYEALRRYPDTAVLFEVYVMPGDDSNTYHASAIAARRRGQQ
ncbi:MAG: hypothetical protein ACF8XB_20160 [Planctomycetota bacterium JB042]